MKQHGTVIEKLPLPRSYRVETPSGKSFRRNRSSLVKCTPPLFHRYEDQDDLNVHTDSKESQSSMVVDNARSPISGSSQVEVPVENNPSVDSEPILRRSYRLRKPVKRLFDEL
ncbi:unnamed protein product [Owenia fusiformis]|uniref:Uncharacterized protein n=1 Tax=Owenia fusiformis TaxID=6347 RepID=A0A8S4Q274_OWEFU|nr:unnamed protein product [Owenia fusiformis]